MQTKDEESKEDICGPRRGKKTILPSQSSNNGYPDQLNRLPDLAGLNDLGLLSKMHYVYVHFTNGPRHGADWAPEPTEPLASGSSAAIKTTLQKTMAR